MLRLRPHSGMRPSGILSTCVGFHRGYRRRDTLAGGSEVSATPCSLLTAPHD